MELRYYGPLYFQPLVSSHEHYNWTVDLSCYIILFLNEDLVIWSFGVSLARSLALRASVYERMALEECFMLDV